MEPLSRTQKIRFLRHLLGTNTHVTYYVYSIATLLHQLVSVGEESGRTASILLKTAATFDQSVKNQMSRLVAALQPGLILLLGIAVGGITVTMLSAVFSMNAVQF